MKKILSIILIFVLIISLSSCYVDRYHDSLDEYIAHIQKHQLGYSEYEIDLPEYFLPSLTFITDYEYEEGGFYFYEEDVFRLKQQKPATSLLYLKYSSEVYLDAKNYMLENMPMYGDEFYYYNQYVFYLPDNSINNQRDFHFTHWFTMACYNDSNNTLVFIGFSNSNEFMEEAFELSKNWVAFMDRFYGEYYNFAE